MKYSELKRMLKNSGCYLHKEAANHEQWYSPKTNTYFLVGRHNTEEVATGTLNNILKQSGIKGGK